MASRAQNVLRFIAIGAAALCAGCQNSATTYELVRGDPDQFRQQYAECHKRQGDYFFRYEINPLEPISPFDKCMRERGFQINRPNAY